MPPQPPTERSDVFEKIAWWMDNAIPIPGTKMRVGIDAVVGLLPGAGDLVITLVQAAFILMAAGRTPGLPPAILLRMMANVAIDCGVGAIPILGDIFDAFFKANTRNLRLLEKAREVQARKGRVPAWPHVAYLIGVALVLVMLIVALAIGVFVGLRWLFHAAFG